LDVLIPLYSIGEILEKATRVLSEEEKAQLEVDFVGKNGEKRKLEVCTPRKFFSLSLKPRLVDHGKAKVKKIIPIRN